MRRRNDTGEKTVEAKVLDVYTRANPSTHLIEDSAALFDDWESVRSALFLDCLKIPRQVFAGADLLEFGAGTGENSVFFARWGARCTLVEVNPAACECGRKIFSRFAPESSSHEFIEKSLFEYESDRRFDIVYSGGVLHHVGDKKAAFAHKVSFLRPRGFVVLGIGEQFGYLQRHHQREIVYSFSTSQADVERNAERFFSHIIDRSVRYGPRERRAVILDNFVNPQIDTPSVGEVLNWFTENGIAYYSAWPPILPGLLGNDVRHAVADIRAHPALAFPAQLFWLTHDEDDAVEIERFVADMGALPGALGDLAGLFNNAQPDYRSATDRAPGRSSRRGPGAANGRPLFRTPRQDRHTPRRAGPHPRLARGQGRGRAASRHRGLPGPVSRHGRVGHAVFRRIQGVAVRGR